MGAGTEEHDRARQDEATVLLVDDEPDVLTAYARALEGEYAVRTAMGGNEALEAMDDSVDIVFLDRRMPEMSGDEVLAQLRKRGYDVPVAMVTAVEPTERIVDMPFDDYLSKPVTIEQLLSKIEVLRTRTTFDEASQQFYRLARKKATLEAEHGPHESQAYEEIVDRMEQLRAEIDDTLDDLLESDPTAAFQDL